VTYAMPIKEFSKFSKFSETLKEKHTHTPLLFWANNRKRKKSLGQCDCKVVD
jgi:hypothetical protein